MNELNEKDLDLIVEEKNLGSLKTNALNIQEKVKEILPQYNAENYNSENIEKAVKDRILLNKSAKALNDKRIELEKEFNKPFEDFKIIIKDTCDLIKSASDEIDKAVKNVENKEKGEKKDLIKKYFDENVGSLKELIKLEKIFNDRWLNKTFKQEDIEKEISDKLSQIRNDLQTIETLNSNYETELKTYYLENLDLSLTIKRDHDLKEKDEILAKQSGQAVIEKKQEEVKQMNEMAEKKVDSKIYDPTMTYTLEITGTESQLVALRKFMEVNNMTFRKVER
jgi:hypothetical protein